MSEFPQAPQIPQVLSKLKSHFQEQKTIRSHFHDRKPTQITLKENKYDADISNARNNALKRIFGPTMKSFEFPEDTKATDIFRELFNHVFDSGTNRSVSCDIHTEEGIVHLSEAAVPIHSRSSFIAHSMEQIQKGEEVEFGMIDLQNFRDADFDLGSKDRGIHSADILINKSARIIRSTLAEIWNSNKEKYAGQSFELGRYGGDEFVLGFFGDKAIGEKDELMKKVREALENETGYYKNNGVIHKLPIKLKEVDKESHSVVEWLSPPKEEKQREVFLDFFQRGTLLNQAEFHRLIAKYSPTGVFDMDLYRKDYPLSTGVISYPKEVGEDLEKRIEYITKNHPELKTAFYYAKTYDDRDNNSTSRQAKLLKIIEDSIFDRLLGDMIYSKTHFNEHIQKGEIDNLYILDFKFLKEINTGMTYADADAEIKNMWERIKKTLSENDRKKVIVSRFAGAFYIGVRKGEKLDNGHKLKEIQSIPLFNTKGEVAYSVPLGYARKKIHPHECKEYYKVINKAETESDNYFYNALIKDIIDGSSDKLSLLDNIREVNVNELAERNYQVLSKAELYTLHLKGKRKEARISKVKTSINEGFEYWIQSFIGKKKNSFVEISQYMRKIGEIQHILMADLEESLTTPSK